MDDTGKPHRRIRVLVVDDSAFNRQTIAQMIEADPEIEVVGRAADGEEALACVFQLQPDVVTLDLEMPKMDGFSFMRLVMAQRPTPIIVISGLASRENVFRALELGALDFVAKPSQRPTAELRGIEAEVRRKIKLVTQLRVVGLTERSQRRVPATASCPAAPLPEVGVPPARILAIGASTGGPPAIQQLLAQLDRTLPVAIVVTQHMPPRFTTTFAERLQRTTGWRVEEAKGGETLVTGQVLVAPGGFSLTLKRQSGLVVTEVVPAAPDDLFVPSVDRMFTTAASVVGDRLVALVLTGMGSDGARGVRAVHAAGGKVLAESKESAVVFGMPQECIGTGVVDEVLSLAQMPQALARLMRG
ncbi:MAG: chemotaxis-specific protein-glutamate methyltransferase CheB [Polyangia bacterium]